MDINTSGNKQDKLGTQYTLNYNKYRTPEVNNIPIRLPKKVTIPLPRTQKEMRILINALKMPDPATILQNQWIKDNTPYFTILQMGNTIILSIVRQIRRSIELAAAVHIIDRIFKGLDIPVQVPDTNRIIRFEGNSIDIRILLAYKYVI
jgi:hypothetical protein